MTLSLRIVAFGLIALALAACSRGSVSDALGLGKRAPDEFAVARQQPLVIPPEFQLRPPGPGETRSAGSPGDRVRASLTGQTPQAAAPVADAPGGASSDGTSALLARTNRAAADPEIRRAVAQEAEGRDQVEETLVDRLLEWEPDTSADAERQSANQIDGRPAASAEAPIVVRRAQTPLGELVERPF